MKPLLIEPDSRKRVYLGALAVHDLYEATAADDGTIVLTPVKVTPLNHLEAMTETARRQYRDVLDALRDHDTAS